MCQELCSYSTQSRVLFLFLSIIIVIISPFTGGETETQRNYVTFPKPHNWSLVLEFESDPKSHSFPRKNHLQQARRGSQLSSFKGVPPLDLWDHEGSSLKVVVTYPPLLPGQGRALLEQPSQGPNGAEGESRGLAIPTQHETQPLGAVFAPYLPGESHRQVGLGSPAPSSSSYLLSFTRLIPVSLSRGQLRLRGALDIPSSCVLPPEPGAAGRSF